MTGLHLRVPTSSLQVGYSGLPTPNQPQSMDHFDTKNALLGIIFQLKYELFSKISIIFFNC